MFGRYRLEQQLGAGRDGARYRAVDLQAGGAVEVVILGDAASERVRERTIQLRRAALLEHSSARRLIELQLGHDPPYVVFEPVGEEPDPGPRAGHETLSAAFALATGLAEGHRLGLLHGRLGAGAVFGVGATLLKIDWAGLDTGTEAGNSPASPFLASEQRRGEKPAAPADVFALGVWLFRYATGRLPARPDDLRAADDPEVERLLRSMLGDDPDSRPTAAQVAERSAALLNAVTVYTDGTAASSHGVNTVALDLGGGGATLAEPMPRRDRLGRFALREELGQGGMGTVYRGEDLADGSIVAIKVLRASWAQRPDALQRLYKEARLLAEANSPYVTNLVEVNEDSGVHYLALEFVAGTTLARLLAQRGRLDEATALSAAADVARGLAVAHERGIIHRDIKPENVLLIEPEPDLLDSPADGGAGTVVDPPLRVKLSDFGLARHVEESASLHLTQTGAVLGTPLYMAPEQSAGSGSVGPAADVYALGATLYHMLAGRPPFDGSSALALIAQHQSQPLLSLKGVNDSVSDGACEVVAKALAKRPEERYADAGEMLLDLERLRRGEPTGLGAHPKLPACDPRDLVRFEFRWDLDASPRQLWPHVSNTERLNRALGLAAVTFSHEHDPDEGDRQFGQFRTAGMVMSWREYPYEWVEGRKMGVLREFRSGPFQWFVSVVELTPRAGGGTTLTQSIRIAAKGMLGRALAHVKIGSQGRRGMDQVYRRMDAALTGKLGHDVVIDPFEPPATLTGEQRRRLDHWLESLTREGIEPLVAERLGDFLALAPAQEVARIRPLALARRLKLDPDQVVAACLRGAKDGALVLLWDLLCPLCRIPSQMVDTLRALREHGHCEACHLEYELDFANSVELIFRAHPEIREAELGTFCVGGPAHSPHVAAQLRIGAGERVVLDLALGEGAYRLRGPQLPYSVDFRIEPTALDRRWDLALSRGAGPDAPRTLRAGGQVFALTNDTPHELVVRVERSAAREDALTGARASTLPLFRELFPGEILTAGQFVNVATVTLVVTEPDHPGNLYQELGDERAFALVHEQFRLLDACVRRHGGALIKTVNEGVVAAFSDPVAAVSAALDLMPALGDGPLSRDLKLRVAVHRGPAMVATLNDRLDYFGTTVGVAMRLPRLASGGEVVLTPAVATDPGVAALLQSRRLRVLVAAAHVTGLPEAFVHRLTGPASPRD